MGDSENGAEQNADTTNDDIGDAEEGVATAHDGTRSDDDGLGALVKSRREIYQELARVGARAFVDLQSSMMTS